MKPVSIIVAAVGVALVAGIVWVLGPGARWVLEHVDGLAIGGPSGLSGKDLAAALDAVRGRALAVATGLAALAAVYYTARNADTARRTFQLGERGQVTDRYSKAVEQLGNAEAPVRLGGLYALEQLAQDNPDPAFRQTIVDVICAYLRMPYTPPPDGTSPADPAVAEVTAPSTGRNPHEERQVRLTAQRILAEHLRYSPARRWWRFRTLDAGDRYWPGIRLDLTGATLMSFSLRDCRANNARFGGATFYGDAWFGGATFYGDAWFVESTFNGTAGFEGATFYGDARFVESTFNGTAGFGGATFNRFAGFGGATFNRFAGFGGATFNGTAEFERATFDGVAWFEEVTFDGSVDFARATGLEQVRLDGARVAPAEGEVERVWPTCWQVADGADGWQTLRLAVPGEGGPAGANESTRSE